MASRGGPMVEGTDGTDFMHRQRVASQYQLSAINKSRLKTCIFFHFLLFFVMLLKMTPSILDRFDIFILELEELEIPKPMFWEYWWCVSLPVAFMGLSSIRRNNIQAMQIYLGGTIANGVIPVLYALCFFFSDVWTFCNTQSTEDIQTWQGYPLGLLWYAFLIPAIQVHLFSLSFSFKLVSAWRLKGTVAAKKAE